MLEPQKTDWYGARVVPITNIATHPDPEVTALEVTRVMAVEGDPNSGIPVVVRKGEFKIGDLAVYVGIDAVVPTATNRFAFLDPRGKPHRVKARRLRGFFSEGLLTPAASLERSEDHIVFRGGVDLTVQLGITKYIPEAELEPVDLAVTVRATEDLRTGQIRGTGSTLEDWLVACLLRPGAHGGWMWMTRAHIAHAVRAGFCTAVNGSDTNVETDGGTLVAEGDQFLLTVSPTLTKVGRPGRRIASSGTESCPHAHLVPHYDLDALRKWGSAVLVEGEEVVAREKIHGANAAALHDGDRLWCRSRTQWKKRTSDPREDLWWAAACKYRLEEKLAARPGLVLFYEVFGQVQDLRYGSGPGEVFIAVFDACRTGTSINADQMAVGSRQVQTVPLEKRWLDDVEIEQLCKELDLPMAPKVYAGPWRPEAVLALRNGPSQWPGADHCREGIVVRPARERHHHRLGRVVLKVVGEEYKLRK